MEQARLGQRRPDQLQARDGNFRPVQGHGDCQRRVAGKIDCHRVLQLKHLRFANSYSQVEWWKFRRVFLKCWQRDEGKLLENVTERPLPSTSPGQCSAVTPGIVYLIESKDRM